MSDSFFRKISYDSAPLDAYLSDRTAQASSIYSLTDRGREKAGLQLPVPVGTRVRFAFNVGSVLAYNELPEEGDLGSVVLVRTASGDATGEGDHVFVKWDSGKFMVAHKHHLRHAENVRVASNVFQIYSGDLSSLFVQAQTGSDLIHRSSNDLWSMEEKNGSFLLSRLFDEDGEPLKEG